MGGSLNDQISIELYSLNIIEQEIQALVEEIQHEELSNREKAMMTSFLMQLYNGMENIMKRFCKMYMIPLPIGAYYHTELLELFLAPTTKQQQKNQSRLPVLFPSEISGTMHQFRRFRHVIIHGYSFSIEDGALLKAFQEAPIVYRVFRRNVEIFLQSIL